jgi:hypothetical protein
LPTYKQKLKTVKPAVKTIKVWSAEALDTLRGCFECTDWSVFEEVCDSLDSKTDTITDYISFCVDTCIPCKTITLYPNNKPWITKEMKAVLNEKKRAFCSGDRANLKAVQHKINTQMRKCKKQYVDKIEQQFSANDLRYAWSGVKTLIGASKKQHRIETDDSQAFANTLNSFYARFDCHDFSKERLDIINSLTDSETLEITEQQVMGSFNKIQIRKASGPDGIGGIVLKECRQQLSGVFRDLFQASLNTHFIPALWKMSNVIPVPKKVNPTVNNDYRPVALTSIAMKCFEKIVKTLLLKDTDHLLDPMQFAYRPKRGVEDATLTLLNSIYMHLDTSRSYVRLLFVDFSSAFNTIQPYLLLQKLCHLGVNSHIIKWIDAFMLRRPQYVTVNNATSSLIYTSTGAPQGCVISPILFIVYTNDCSCYKPNCIMLKFADDTALAGLLTDSDENYRGAIHQLVDWCNGNFLHLNARKTKEVVIDFRKKDHNIVPVYISTEQIEQVDNYKYLGTYIDSKLSWKDNTNAIYHKGLKRLHFLRCLRQLDVDKTIMILFYKTFILPVITFNFLSWFSSLTVQCKNKLTRLVTLSGKIIGQRMESLDTIFERQTLKKVGKIMSNTEHILKDQYVFLPSGRRLRSKSARSKRTVNSFVHSSIRLFNKKCVK